MCGIAGIIGFNNRQAAEPEIRRMCGIMSHRGPDAEGIYLHKSVGLGHRRLSIIDLSECGNQPISNEDGDIWLVFNGEIYNYPELREILIEKGHIFKSNTDSEVIIHGYEQWEEGVFKKLDGMFAIGIWDERKQRLYLARDRFGKKPLLYHSSNGKLTFASDIKAILETLDYQPAVSPEALDCYLSYLYIPNSHSIFEGIKKVPAGCFARFDSAGERFCRYWDISYLDKNAASEQEYLEILEEKLSQAIEKRLLSDVPLGTMLSGGVDSSLITAMLASRRKGAIKTFSVKFDDRNYDESRYSRLVARMYGTEHTELTVKADMLARLPMLVRHYGEPFGDFSSLPCYFIFQEIKKHVTVVLSGDGGDELFGGYPVNRAFHLLGIYNTAVPLPLRKFLAGAAHNLDRYWGLSWRGRPARYAARFIQCGTLNEKETYRLIHRSGWPNYRMELYTPEFIRQLDSQGHYPDHLLDEMFPGTVTRNWGDNLLYAYIKSRLADDFLVKIDIASMAHAVEVRCPMLDTGLAQAAARIPSHILLKGATSKYLLKKLARKYLPEKLIYRRKMGFSIPLDAWSRREVGDLFEKIILSDTSIRRGLFRREFLQHILRQHNTAREDHSARLWSLLWLEIWFRMFIDRSISPTDSLMEIAG